MSKNFPLLLTAPDAYFKQKPSLREQHEGRKRAQARENLVKLEHFRQHRVEVTLTDALNLARSAMHMEGRGLSPSEVAEIDAAHADLSREIQLWQAEARLPFEPPLVPAHTDEEMQVAIPLRRAEQVREVLEKADSCVGQLRVAAVTFSSAPYDKGQVVMLVPLSAVIFMHLLYLRGWAVTEDHMPRPTRQVMLAVHHIQHIRPMRRRLEYAPALPPLEQDYSFGMDAGRVSFEAQLHSAQCRKDQIA